MDGPIKPVGSSILPQVLLVDAGCEWENYASDSEFRVLFSLLDFFLLRELMVDFAIL